MLLGNSFSNKFFFTGPIFLLLFFLCFSAFIHLSNSQTKDSSDAISIRVFPNPEHYSPLRWYKEKGFKGSPQALFVDSYDAVRDGNAVYINAANTYDYDGDGIDDIYTFIYAFVFNQSAESLTEKIFTQFIDNLKFNEDYTTSAQCFKTSTINCLSDDQCPRGDYCLSDKAKIVRDVKRMSRLKEIDIALNDYKNKFGNYPKLTAGTYISNLSLSAWPSWANSFAKDTGQSLPIDPINSLGDCGDIRFDPKTCWDDKAKEFPTNLNARTHNYPLPANSHVFIYANTNNGLDYDLCAITESPLSADTPASCAGSPGFSATTPNRAPYFTNWNFPPTTPGNSYSASLSAVDEDGDNITWSIDTSMTAWNGWLSAPTLEGTSNNQRSINAPSTGLPGTYNFSISISDDDGLTTTQNFYINVSNGAPVISPLSCTNIIRIGEAFSCPVSAADPEGDPITFSLNSPPPGLTIDANSGIISGTPTASGLNPLNIIAADSYSGSSNAVFNLSVNTYCGDGTLQSPTNGEGINENCDGSDGIALTPAVSNINTQYSCSSVCAPSGGFCGDGIVQASESEFCDDGNKNTCDGCSDSCTIETNWSCANTTGATPESTCTPNTIISLCNAKPGGAATVWNSVSSITRTQVGCTGFSPPASALNSIYNTVPSTLQCRYACASGYVWNTSSSQCVLACDPAMGTACGVAGLCSSAGTIQCDGTCSSSNFPAGTSCDSCGTPITDTRDGKVYDTVLVNNQCWMAENLNIGNPIIESDPTGTNHTHMTNNGVIEKYCPANSAANCNTQGGLYDWDEMMEYATTPGIQGICPTGWHIPTDGEWYVLENNLKSISQPCDPNRDDIYSCSIAGTKLKLGGSANFDTLYAGNRVYQGQYLGVNTAQYWSSTQINASEAWGRVVADIDAGVRRNSYEQKHYGLSVRCVRDDSPDICDGSGSCQTACASFQGDTCTPPTNECRNGTWDCSGTVCSATTNKADGLACGPIITGGFNEGSCLAGTCDTTCPNTWEITGNRCLLNKYNERVDWATAVSACTTYGGWLPSVADLNAIPCSELDFRYSSHTLWGSVKTTSPSSAGHYSYLDSGPFTGCPDITCGINGWNSPSPGICNPAVTNLPDWRTDVGYVCLKNQN